MISVTIPKKAFLPCYHHLIESKSDIDFLWGGRDSGKSRFIASILLVACMQLPYFRCVLVRKVFNTIKESQWQMIKDVATLWGIDHLFSFNTNPLEIKCVNGNRFICRGMDDSANLKSISNPSHCWAEEMNQITMDDFILIMTSLRCNDGKVKMWCSFNPEAEGDYTDFWLYKTFYENQHGQKSFTSTWSIEIPAFKEVTATKVDYTYTSTHTTYHDNRYCRPERAAFLEQLYFLDPYYYKVFTLGEWGNRKNDDPFCFTFSREKHVSGTTLNHAYDVKLSFDFNVNPITCGVIQDYDFPKIIEAIKLDNSDIYKLCDYINAHYPGCLFVVTGDATGRNTTALVQDGINYYTVIKSKLNLSTGQIKVPSVNPKVKENRVLVNAVFHSVPIAIDPLKGKGLIYDCENVSVNDMGEIEKGDRSNPKKRADHLDWFRYYCNTFQKHVLKQ